MGRSGEVEGEEGTKKMDWMQTVKTRIKVRQVLLAPTEGEFFRRLALRYPNDTHMEIYHVLDSLLTTSVGDDKTSQNLKLLQAMLASDHTQSAILHCLKYSDLGERMYSRRSHKSNPLVAASAQFHAKYGLTNWDIKQFFRTWARLSTYWVANFKESALYGPFMTDSLGKVEWPCIEALTAVIGVNVQQAMESGAAADVTSGGVQLPIPLLQGLAAARPGTQVQTVGFQSTPGDWAGVTGRWRRVVCFLDYRDLHAYNFSGKELTAQSLAAFIEAMRVMTLQLAVTHVGLQKPGDREWDDVLPMSLWHGDPSRPPIFFQGTSTSSAFSHPVSKVRGCVSKTPDGQVRWTLVSTYGGEDRWASEGIQVGGEQSAWGVIGMWSDVDRTDDLAPSGPFYFFKMTD